MNQHQLFPLSPTRPLPRLTDEQRRILDAIELAAGRPLCEVAFNRPGDGKGYCIGDRGQCGVLRRLIAQGCVEVMTMSPAIYRVTKIGKIVRRLS